jgi:hypothetical protein
MYSPFCIGNASRRAMLAYGSTNMGDPVGAGIADEVDEEEEEEDDATSAEVAAFALPVALGGEGQNAKPRGYRSKSTLPRG